MRRFLRAPYPFLVPVGIAAALLALLIGGFTGQPSTGWGGQSATVNDEHMRRIQAISDRFQDGSIAISRMRPIDSQAAAQARERIMNQFQKDANAENLRWQAQVQQINHATLVTEGLFAAFCLLLALSLTAFAARFYSFLRFRRQPLGL